RAYHRSTTDILARALVLADTLLLGPGLGARIGSHRIALAGDIDRVEVERQLSIGDPAYGQLGGRPFGDRHAATRIHHIIVHRTLVTAGLTDITYIDRIVGSHLDRRPGVKGGSLSVHCCHSGR